MRGSRKSNFGWRRGDPDQADELDLIVFLERAAEELELPVGPPAHVEHPIRPAPLIDDNQPAVVGERLLAGRRVSPAACSAFFSSRRGERMDLIEVHAFVFRAKLESKAERFAVSRRQHLLAFDFLAVSSATTATIGLPENPTARDVGPDDRRGRLEIGLADRYLADAHVLGHAA